MQPAGVRTDSSQDGQDSIIGAARSRMRNHPHKVFLKSHYAADGTRTDELYHQTWGQLERNVQDLAKGLLGLGLAPFDRIAVFAPNCPRWIEAVFSCLMLRTPFVPIYPTVSKADLQWCLLDSDTKAVFCYSQDQLDKALQVRSELESLRWIITMDPTLECDHEEVHPYSDLLSAGHTNTAADQQLESLCQQVEPQDLVTVIYTSGTTGRPKGVMLTNQNFVSQRVIADEYGFRPTDVWFAHLPMCHSLGFTCDLLNSGHQGGELFIVDSVQTQQIRKDLALCRPTVMTSVPRLWEKLYLQIQEIVRNKPKAVQTIFEQAVQVGIQAYKLQNQHKPLPLSLKIKLKLAQRVFDKVKKQAGLDRLRLCMTGGGPIHPDLLLFFGAMGIHIFQGYGLTETSPITHASTPKNNKIGWIGKAIPNTEFRIAEDGELLIKGPQVMSGYLNNEESTKSAFTPDGYFMTGDIAEADQHGFVRISDRKKELIITSGGKNISPQHIQNAFNTDPYFEQVFVVGDGRKYLAALVVPNFGALGKWAAEQGISYSTEKELIDQKAVRDLYQERIDQTNSSLSRYETIKQFALIAEAFSEEGGELTPTLKFKRKVVEQKYKSRIETLYPKETLEYTKPRQLST